MSQENVEIVLAVTATPTGTDLVQTLRDDKLWAAFIAARAPLLHADFECAAHGMGAHATYPGTDGLRAFWLDWTAPYATVRSEIESATDCGERVLILVREYGRRVDSDQEISGNNAGVWTIRDGKVARFDAYADRAEALKAVGLNEQAMARENLEVVERAIAAINARHIDGYLACCTEDVRLETPLTEISGVYEGRAAIRRFFDDLSDTTEDFQLSIERLEATGPAQVLAFVRVTSSGRASGIQTAKGTPTCNLYDLVGGKIAHIRVFLDRRDALKAVGLAE